MTETQKIRLADARAAALNATSRYNRAWKAEPTAKGYPRVETWLSTNWKPPRRSSRRRWRTPYEDVRSHHA